MFEPPPLVSTSSQPQNVPDLIAASTSEVTVSVFVPSELENVSVAVEPTESDCADVQVSEEALQLE